jgi:NADH-ubiquinone oxidoreductase chain 3
MVALTPIFFLAVLIPLLLTLVAYITASRHLITQDTRTPFECGFDPKNSARTPFSLRFFLLAVIFLIFDVEVALLLPIPLCLQLPSRLTAILTLTLFLVLLIVGLFHEWREGTLEWI